MVPVDRGVVWARRPRPESGRWHRVATVDDLGVITACDLVIVAPLDAAGDPPASELACALCA